MHRRASAFSDPGRSAIILSPEPDEAVIDALPKSTPTSNMTARVAETDWSQTPLGRSDAWPPNLRSALSICLGSAFPIAIYWGPELVLLYNDAWSPIPGAKHPWALGRPAREVWSEIWDIISPLFDQVLRTGRATRSEDQLLPMYRHGYTEECYFDYTFSPIRDEHGEVAGVFNAVVETTFRVIAARRQRLLRRLGDALLTIRTVDEVLNAAAEVLGESPVDVPFVLLYRVDATGGARLGAAYGIGDVPASAWPLEDPVRAIVVERLAERIDSVPAGPWPEPVSSALVLPIPNPARPGALAATAVFGISARVALDDDYRAFFAAIASQIGSAVAMASAQEEERRRTEQLAELDRAKTAFFSNVSHEFRTPLALMLGPLDELLTSPDATDPSLRDRLALIARNARRLLRLVNSLLEVTRIEAGRVQCVFEPVDLSVATADLASAFRSAIETAGMRLVVDCPPVGEPVYVDRDMWEKIVLNLVANAFKFTLEGTIRVAIERRDDAAVLTVEDTGIGIPAAELPSLFNRFHRVEGAGGRTQEGSGIGLALVQELARLHGGGVSVVSEEHAGSTFTVRIPLGVEHLPADRIGAERSPDSTWSGSSSFIEEALSWIPKADGAEPSIVRHTGAGRARILLADDNADMREYITRLLAPEYDVTAVADGLAALEAARESTPDLVVSDAMMPRLDGFGLVASMRADERLQTVPIVLLSARAGEESRVEGIEAGADDYLVKPFAARELLARVATNLDMSRLRAETAVRERELRTEAETARQRAEEASRAKDEFLATVSHELRTPLNSMLGWARLLRAGRLDEETAERALETIERNTISQAQLIDDLLDISRIITGKLRLNVQPVELDVVVAAAIDSIRPAADAKEIRMQTVLDTYTGAVLGDPERLQQVVWNLVSNAVKFTPKGGTVQVHLERVNSHVELSVTDTGRGIDPEFLPYVFDRFKQADSSITREHGGLGLGLAIVRHIMELHGGAVSVASDGRGKGASFVASIPLTLSRRALAGAERVSTASRSAMPFDRKARLTRVRVLAVDDELDTRDLVAHVLSACGADVRLAASASEARALLDASDGWTPDVIVSDVGMPFEDGYTFIRSVRAHAAERIRRTPALALTAYARAEDRVRLLSAGFESHLPKPVEPAELVAVVESLARRRR